MEKSLDLVWKYAFHELDEWAKCADHCDEVFLNEVGRFFDSVQRNQGNIKGIAEQFTKEFTEWEKTTRDELAIENYLEMFDQYIYLRKKRRVQFIKTVKKAGNPLYEYQKEFVNLFATSFKELIFPLNKYMESTVAPTKS